MLGLPSPSLNQELPVDMFVIGHAMRMSLSRDSAISGQSERVSMAVKGFLDPENQDWDEDIQDGGCFNRGNPWIQYVGLSTNLRILTLLLCSRRTANFITNQGKEPYSDVKKELLAVLSKLNGAEKSIFMKHIWPVIEPYMNNWDYNYSLLHSFNVFVVEDLLAEIQKVQYLVQKIFGIKIPEVLINKQTALGHIADERTGNFDTNIFIVDGAVPQNKESPGTVSTAGIIEAIRKRFPSSIIISNTSDSIFLEEHSQVGVDYFGHKDTELLNFILQHILLKKLTN